MQIATLSTDNDNISDSRDGGNVWDDILTVLEDPDSDESILSLEISLLWHTTVQAGEDPYIEYRVVRRIGAGELEEIFAPAVLNASISDPTRNRFPFIVFDEPGTTQRVTYVLQARGRGYNFSSQSTCYGTRQVWVPPVTDTQTETTTGSVTRTSTVSAIDAALRAIEAYDAATHGSTGCGITDQTIAIQEGSWIYTVDYECTTETEVEVEPGYYRTESYSFPCTSSGYQSSAGLVALERGTSMHARQSSDTPLALVP